jgi:hypothetical protein
MEKQGHHTMAASNDKESSFDPRRRLCPDGSCVGVLGGDGKCPVCGTVDTDARAAGAAEGQVNQAEDFEAEPDDAGEEPFDEESPAGSFDPNRRLCGDDTCVGVIGPNQRCSVCGRAADG